MALRDQVLDDALAGAKRHSHAAVEPRHVLWAIVHVLGSNAPDDLKAANVRRFLDPAGTAIEPPAVSPEATAILDAISDDDTAIAQARTILASLEGGAGRRRCRRRRREVAAAADGARPPSLDHGIDVPPRRRAGTRPARSPSR